MGAAEIGTLKGIGFFADLSDFDLTQIAGITAAKNYDRGEMIVEERAAAERFFIIARGKIEISKRFEDGERFVLAVHSDGEFFGEMALLDEGPRSATVRALEPTTVLEISRPEFETLLYKAPVLAYRILRELSSRLRETGALLVSYLEQRNVQTYRAYLQTVAGFLRKVGAGGPQALERVEYSRALARAAGRELGLPEEALLIAEIGIVLRALDLPSAPPGLPEGQANPDSRAERLGAAAEAFAVLLPVLPASAEAALGEVRKRLGPRFDAPAAEALLRLRQEGQLPPPA
jgi:CRP-like cAMP-binding protein